MDVETLQEKNDDGLRDEMAKDLMTNVLWLGAHVLWSYILSMWILWILWYEFSYVLCQPYQKSMKDDDMDDMLYESAQDLVNDI